MLEEDVLLFWDCHGFLNIVGQDHGKGARMAGNKDGYKGKRSERVPFNTMEMN
jgi:hypothetical protein